MIETLENSYDMSKCMRNLTQIVRGESQASYVLTFKNTYDPNALVLMPEKQMQVFLVMFADCNIEEIPLAWGSFTHDEISFPGYVWVWPDVVYKNAGQLRYMAVDLLEISYKCHPMKLIRPAYVG